MLWWYLEHIKSRISLVQSCTIDETVTIKVSPAPFLVPIKLFIFLGFIAAGGMGLWHGVDYFENEKIRAAPFRGSWDDVSAFSH